MYLTHLSPFQLLEEMVPLDDGFPALEQAAAAKIIPMQAYPELKST